MKPKYLRIALRVLAGLVLVIVGSGVDWIYVPGVDWGVFGLGLFFWSFAVEG
jgi:uncharacterized membrane protein YccC